MDIAKFIDHSILRPNHTLKELEEEIGKCLHSGVYAVCVNPFWVKKAKELSGAKMVVCSVVSFPFGLDHKEHKVLQSVKAIEDGAEELDIVMNLSAFKSGMVSYVEEELRVLARETEGTVRKVIIETAYLTTEEKELALKLIEDSGMEFVKTSTGYAPTGATEEDVRLLVSLSKGRVKIKASGGIRSLEQVVNFINLGASRIGTSKTFDILKEARLKSGGRA